LLSLGLDPATVTQALDGAPVSAQELAQAKMLKAARMSDEAWIFRYAKGGLLERSEMTRINLIIASEVAA
jgi:hypothetical protein